METYNKAKYRDLFIKEGVFHVPQDHYSRLSESQRTTMFWSTKLVLEHMTLIEEYTSDIRKSLSDKACYGLASSVIALANAFEEQEKKAKDEDEDDKGKKNATGSEREEIKIKEDLEELLELQEFKQFRFIKAFCDSDEISESYERALLRTEYHERSAIFDYIHEMWRQAAYDDMLNKSISVQDRLKARQSREEWSRQQKAKMDAYLDYMTQDRYTMSGV